ncbi:hypothetical protein [Clostridium uliginosum]|uniref:Uncharacterized protein n=1 Tax=Clostridium uliginosum TaxID=119641 RepID=A0A1I1I6B7_9CLOT|nr:hypothetical protein [Clostridium uliginosum]SFC29788.1 hypothetical protein SAMN05421842_10280 [Clostridium uliginosum]
MVEFKRGGIIFREKRKYCKDADMYLVDNNNTSERKLKKRKLIKIMLIITLVPVILMPYVMDNNYSKIAGYNNIKISAVYFVRITTKIDLHQ